MRVIDDEDAGSTSAASVTSKIILTRAGVYRKVAAGQPKPAKKTNAYREEVRKLMYGFGDSKTPDEKSLDLMEALVEETLVNLISQASRRS